LQRRRDGEADEEQAEHDLSAAGNARRGAATAELGMHL